MATTTATPYLSIAAAADRCDCSVRTIRRHIAAGLITGYRFGPRLLRVDPAELDAMLRPIPTASGGHNAA